MIWILNILSVCSVEKVMYGMWNNSSPRDETMMFVEELFPELVPQIEQIIPERELTIPVILQRLEPIMNSNVLGLLNVTLWSRYYNPRASLKHPLPGNPSIPGWSAEVEIPNTNDLNISDNNMRWRILSAMSSLKSDEKFELLHQLSHNFAEYLPVLSEFDIDNDVITKYPIDSSKRVKSIVNGRTCGTSMHDVIKCLIDESKTKTTRFDKFTVPIHAVSKILTVSLEEPWFYTDDPPAGTGTLLHSSTERAKIKNWGNKFRKGVKDPTTFLMNEGEMININIFLRISSPEYSSLLKLALDIEKTAKPYSVRVFLIPNLDDPLEKKIAYAFISLKELGDRPPVFFLDQAQKMSWKNAYKKCYANKAWDKIEELYKEGWVHDRIMALDTYVKEKEIRDVAVSINGQFINANPVFPEVEAQIRKHTLRLMKLAENDEVSPDEDWKSWFRHNAVHLKTALPPMEIDMRNYMSTEGVDLYAVIANMYECSKGGDESGIPVICSGYVPQATSSGTMVFLTDKANKETKKFFRLNDGKVTIVGPLRFARELTMNELLYALEYVNFRFMKSMPNIPQKLKIHEIFVKGQRVLSGIKGDDGFSSDITYGSSGYNTWKIQMDIFDREFPSVIDTAVKLADAGVAKIMFSPIIPSAGVTNLKNILKHRVVECDSFGCISGDFEISAIRFPKTWTVVDDRDTNSFNITTIYAPAFVTNSTRIHINEVARSVSRGTGFLVANLPVGIYPMIGTSQKEFVIDQFVMLPQIFDGLETTERDGDTKLGVMVMSNNPYANSIEKTLASLVQTCTAPMKILIVTNHAIRKIHNYEFEVTPLIMPVWCDVDAGVFHDELAYLMTVGTWNDCDSVLFVDGNIVWKADAGKFNELQMMQCVVAIPEMTSDKQFEKQMMWMRDDIVMQRMARPYHNAAMMFFLCDKWKDQGGDMIAKEAFDRLTYLGLTSRNIISDVMNVVQLKIQILTLPNTIAWNSASNTGTVPADVISIQNGPDVTNIDVLYVR